MTPQKLHGFGKFLTEYLGEFVAICKSALARESGPNAELFDLIKPRGENIMTLSLLTHL
jgi:hypothetical protein